MEAVIKGNPPFLKGQVIITCGNLIINDKGTVSKPPLLFSYNNEQDDGPEILAAGLVCGYWLKQKTEKASL